MSRIDEDQFRTTVRKRTIATDFVPWAIGEAFSGIYPDPIKYIEYGPRLYDAQITESEGHPFWANIKDLQGLKPDLGGNFHTTRWAVKPNKTVYSSHYVDDTSSHRLWQHAGPYVPNIKEAYYSVAHGWGYITKDTNPEDLAFHFPAKTSSVLDLNAFGTTAIARTRPDKSPAHATQFLVELRRDGIPFIAKLSKKEFKRILNIFQTRGAGRGTKHTANYFLENQFGLQPFVADLTDFSRLAISGHSVIDDLMKNSGKLIRRRYVFPDENFSSSQGTTSSREVWGPNRFGGNYTHDENILDTAVNTHRKTWFSGAYRIYMPTDLEPVSRLSATVDKLRWDYGLTLDFETLWNIAPWSWLLDWEFNLGDVIANVSKFRDDAVVLHYGYMMQKTATTYTVSNTGQFVTDTAPTTAIPDFVLEVVDKRRVRATPYGFGTTFGSLNAGQLSILAALGITRF